MLGKRQKINKGRRYEHTLTHTHIQHTRVRQNEEKKSQLLAELKSGPRNGLTKNEQKPRLSKHIYLKQ